MQTHIEREAAISAAAGSDYHAAEWARWWAAHEDVQVQRQGMGSIESIPTGPSPAPPGVHHETRSGPGTASVTGYPPALFPEIFFEKSVRVTTNEAPEDLAKRMDEGLDRRGIRDLMVEHLKSASNAEIADLIDRLFTRAEAAEAEVERLRAGWVAETGKRLKAERMLAESGVEMVNVMDLTRGL